MSKAISQSKEMKNKVSIEAAMNDGFEDIRDELTSTDYCNLQDLYRIKKELSDTQTLLNGDVLLLNYSEVNGVATSKQLLFS